MPFKLDPAINTEVDLSMGLMQHTPNVLVCGICADSMNENQAIMLLKCIKYMLTEGDNVMYVVTHDTPKLKPWLLEYGFPSGVIHVYEGDIISELSGASILHDSVVVSNSALLNDVFIELGMGMRTFDITCEYNMNILEYDKIDLRYLCNTLTSTY